MKIRASRLNDIDRILEIYEIAKKYMRDNGNPYQWDSSYPSRRIIENDIEQKTSFVIVDDDDIPNATFMFCVGDEPSYAKIFDGKWLNDNVYGVIHRMAKNSLYKGIFSEVLDFCSKKCNNIRVDTHLDNKTMQALLNKHSFVYCGIIYLENGSKRIAFQRQL